MDRSCCPALLYGVLERRKVSVLDAASSDIPHIRLSTVDPVSTFKQLTWHRDISHVEWRTVLRMSNIFCEIHVCLCLFVCLSVCLFVCLFVALSVCQKMANPKERGSLSLWLVLRHRQTDIGVDNGTAAMLPTAGM
jgi:hypothetical protein